MPCGGIHPCHPLGKDKEELSAWYCYQCNGWLDVNKKAPDHFCEEWDCVLHGECVEEFLRTDEGRLVIDHGHLIQIYDQILQEENEDEVF